MQRRANAAALVLGSTLVLLGCSDDPYVIGGFLDEACAEPPAGTLFCSGFEQPDLSDWDRRIVINAANVEQTESLRFSGRGALHASSTDHESAGAVAIDFSAQTEGELFLRVFMYVPDGLETKTTNVLFLGDEPAPDPFKGIDFNLESGAPEIFLPENDPVRFTSTALVIPRDRWFCYSVRVLISEDAGSVTIGVEGQIALEESGLDTLSTGGVHLLRAGVDWSSKQTSPFDIYMDELVLSTEELGCAPP